MSLPSRFPLRELDLSQFTPESDASVLPAKRSTPPSPLKPTKRRHYGDDGIPTRVYRYASLSTSSSASSSSSLSSAEPDQADPFLVCATTTDDSPLRRTRHSGSSLFPSVLESQDPSSPHYCGFSIFREPPEHHTDASCSPCSDEEQHQEEEGQEHGASKENTMPPRPLKHSRKLSSRTSLSKAACLAPSKLFFPEPCQIELGDKIYGYPSPTSSSESFSA